MLNARRKERSHRYFIGLVMTAAIIGFVVLRLQAGEFGAPLIIETILLLLVPVIYFIILYATVRRKR